ncbi:NAD-dependent epimerase/dehydratase family protein [Agarilytica rhodophyticola]|uniref:NAD-dependent epimerase/dehydratase family protein n=1 Tax=Agarilytica rhodophyticola TaxID=1737490 RepID=UPI000B345D77|nr:NAD-dependent epimerase/dehydratase family protein [Agarilytica rhodophyticola]
MANKHLFIGFGEIASLCASHLVANGDSVVGIARRTKPVVPGVTLWQGDVLSHPILQRVSENCFDSAIITMTPSSRGPDGYRRAYFDVVDVLLRLWRKNNAPKRILFISSTSVYGQSDDEVVNEDSLTEPKSETAKVLLETEQLLLDSGLKSTIIRFSGIYGPGRDYLLRQVKDLKGGDDTYTNRIHIEDCCGVICHLLATDVDKLDSVYLASDHEPVKSREIRTWLAARMNIGSEQLVTQTSSRGGNKQCDNSKLLKSGYVFRYPSYKEGYVDAVKVFLGTNIKENNEF